MWTTQIRLVAALLVVAAPLGGQAQPLVPAADYERWETLGAGTLSPDGRWFVYRIRRVDESHELRLRRTGTDSTRVLPWAANPAFAPTSRWLAYRIEPSLEDRDGREEGMPPARSALGLLDLDSGAERRVEGVREFSFSPDGAFLAYHRYAPEERRGADLIVHRLADGTSSNFGNVAEYAWHAEGSRLAMAIDVEGGAANGVHLYDPARGTLRVLESSTARYSGLAWREDRLDLAVLRSRPEDSAWADTAYAAVAWRDLSRPTPPRVLPGPPQSPDLRISAQRSPAWSEDGQALLLGLRPREAAAPPADSSEPGDVSEVQIWHARDFRIIPMQRAQEQRDRRATMLAVWRLDADRLVRVGTDLHERVTVLPGDAAAIETESAPYRFDEMFGRVYDDLHLVDLLTGDRRRIAERVRHVFGGSATGRYVLYFQGEDFHVFDTRTSETRNLTGQLDATFANLDYDYPVRQFPPFGVAGWAADDRAVLIYDEYDVWRIDPASGTGVRLTNGADDRIRYRRVRLDPDEDGIDLDAVQYFSMTGERTKRSGFARWEPGGGVETLVYDDARLGRLTRADSAPVFAYTRERFDDSPDYVVAGADLADPAPLTATNPFQAGYAWGRAELVDFTSETGRELQAALLYPANYDPSRRYPMIVYNYEILSHRLHWYVPPSERSYYNFTVWTQHGYFVLLPDIVYRGRDPGRSAVEAIVPAVGAVVARGLVDPARVGLVGHSWGGYQATYVPTQTNIFAASVAGAPLTNFLSMMGAVHWNPGLPETQHWETGQARMEVPFWEDFDAHVRNSPAAFVHRLETPMLMTFGDDDGVVDWRQGVEFYNYARRAGKDDFVLLVYPGEDHGLRQEANQRDYHRRILQWFGHYLKGEPAPAWIAEGVPYLERRREIAEGNGR